MANGIVFPDASARARSAFARSGERACVWFSFDVCERAFWASARFQREPANRSGLVRKGGGVGGIKITCRILVVRSESVRKAFDYKRTHSAHIVCAILLEMRYCKYDFFAPIRPPIRHAITTRTPNAFLRPRRRGVRGRHVNVMACLYNALVRFTRNIARRVTNGVCLVFGDPTWQCYCRPSPYDTPYANRRSN